MNYLAIDTSSNYLTVIAEKEGVLTQTHLSDCSMNHSVKLLPTVEETLKKAGMVLADADFFAVNVGAGSFTGIRIGISSVKGFCTALEKPALPVTSFDCIAYTVNGGENVLAVISAGHGYYYVCGYDKDKNVILAPRYISEAEVNALAEEYTLAGFEDLPFESCIKADMAEGLALAVYGNEKKFGTVPAEELTALYVRKSQAEENRK